MSSISTQRWLSFITSMKDANKANIIEWNRHREWMMRDDRKKREIFLREIEKYNCNDPLNMVEYANRKENYDTNLLVTQLRPIKNIFDQDNSFMHIMEAKESLELHKKIIEHYWNYIVEENFTAIMTEINKWNLTEVYWLNSNENIKQMKARIEFVRTKYLKLNVNIALKKQKLRNMLIIKAFVNNYLQEWIKKLTVSKESKKNNQYAKWFQEWGNIQYDISTWSSNNNIIKKQNWVWTDILSKRLKKKMEKVKLNWDGIINKLFIDKKNDWDEIFSLFSAIKTLQFQNPYDEFINTWIRTLKSTVLKLSKDNTDKILGTVDSIKFIETNENRERFSNFKHINLNETQFIMYIQMFLNSLLVIGNCFNSFIRDHNKSELRKIIFNKREIFFSMFEKKVSKICKLLFLNIPTVSNAFTNKRNFMLFLVYLNWFSECMKHDFQVESSKNIKDLCHEIVLSHLNSNTKIHIRKIGIMLGGDNWKRIALQDNNEIFAVDQCDIPIHYKKYLSFFTNEGREYIHTLKTNNKIADLFKKILEDPDSIIQYNKNTKTKRWSKPFINADVILSTSSYAMIKSIGEYINDIQIYESWSYDIFKNIFYIVDYYILAAVNWFMIHKSYFAQIFEVIDIEETKKKNSLLTTNEFALFWESFMHLRKWFNNTKRSWKDLYNGIKIDFLSNLATNDDSDTMQIYFPKWNSQVWITENNIYSLLIESLVLVESIISIYKVVKRWKHFWEANNPEHSVVVKEKFYLYKQSIKELRSFLYKPWCANIFRLEPFSVKMQNQKWEITDASSIDFTTPSPFISGLNEEIFDKYEKLNSLSGGSLTDLSQVRFFEVLLQYVIDNWLLNVARIKKSNSNGRSVLLKDIKWLKNNFETYLQVDNARRIDWDKAFNKLIMYVNAWYYTEKEFIDYIKESKLEYKYSWGLMYYGENFISLNKTQRKDLQSKIDDWYYQIIEAINNKLKNDMN